MKRTVVAPVVVLLLVAVLIGGLSCPAKRMAEQPMPASPPPPSAAPMAGSAAPGVALESKSADMAMPSRARGGEGEVGSGSSAKPAENQLDPFKVRAQQMIIYVAHFTIKVEKAAEAADKLRALADKYAGFVSGLTENVDTGGTTRVTMTVRVPSEHFNDVVSGLEGLGKVDEESLETENVTEEWVDLNARLGIKELRKLQLEALLKRANSVEEVDQRQQQINTVQEEIERIQGRQHVLQNQVALSTLNVSFYEKGLAPLGKPGPFSARNVVVRAWYALLAILRVLYAILVWVALPGAVIWIPVTIIVLWRRAHPKPKRFPPTPPPA